MEQASLVYLMAPISFYFKISFVLFLFILNMYLIITHKKEAAINIKNNTVLQAGIGIKNLKGVIHNIALIGGFLSALITVKNELKDIQIGKLDRLQEGERENIRKSIDKDREEHQRLLDSIDNNRDELFNLHIEKAKLLGHNDRLLTLHNNLKSNITSYQDKSTDSTTKLSDLGILDQLIKQDTKKFGEELNSLILAIEVPLVENTHSTLVGDVDIIDNLKDLKESSILYFNIFTSIDWFEGLNGIKKIAVCIILGKSIVFSALLSIIFIFYGNILIEKYDLENRYPKLAKLIQLRRKFQNYYFKYYCGLIISVIVIEIAFGVAVLLL